MTDRRVKAPCAIMKVTKRWVRTRDEVEEDVRVRTNQDSSSGRRNAGTCAEVSASSLCKIGEQESEREG